MGLNFVLHSYIKLYQVVYIYILQSLKQSRYSQQFQDPWKVAVASAWTADWSELCRQRLEAGELNGLLGRWHLWSPGAGLSNPGGALNVSDFQIPLPKENAENTSWACETCEYWWVLWVNVLQAQREAAWMDSISSSQDDVRMLWEVNLPISPDVQ